MSYDKFRRGKTFQKVCGKDDTQEKFVYEVNHWVREQIAELIFNVTTKTDQTKSIQSKTIFKENRFNIFKRKKYV